MSFSRVARIEIPLLVVRREKERERKMVEEEKEEEKEEKGASFVTRNPPWTN